MTQDSYRSQYTEKGFHQKLADIPKAAGCEIFEQALLLYVMLTEQDVPNWVKASIIGALGYLICPIDAVPDFLPGGYLDDLAVMAMVLAKINFYDTPAGGKRPDEKFAAEQNRRQHSPDFWVVLNI